jgi:glycyl-tRNA synthetase beta subunit
MNEAERLGKQEELSDSDWDYIMTMGHSEYRDYRLSVSRDRGYINHVRQSEILDLKLSKADIKAIVECIKSNATLEADIKEELLKKIRATVDVS